jgi:hypothetical protein
MRNSISGQTHQRTSTGRRHAWTFAGSRVSTELGFATPTLRSKGCGRPSRLLPFSALDVARRWSPAVRSIKKRGRLLVCM